MGWCQVVSVCLCPACTLYIEMLLYTSRSRNIMPLSCLLQKSSSSTWTLIMILYNGAGYKAVSMFLYQFYIKWLPTKIGWLPITPWFPYNILFHHSTFSFSFDKFPCPPVMVFIPGRLHQIWLPGCHLVPWQPGIRWHYTWYVCFPHRNNNNSFFSLFLSHSLLLPHSSLSPLHILFLLFLSAFTTFFFLVIHSPSSLTLPWNNPFIHSLQQNNTTQHNPKHSLILPHSLIHHLLFLSCPFDVFPTPYFSQALSVLERILVPIPSSTLTGPHTHTCASAYACVLVIESVYVHARMYMRLALVQTRASDL